MDIDVGRRTGRQNRRLILSARGIAHQWCRSHGRPCESPNPWRLVSLATRSRQPDAAPDGHGTRAVLQASRRAAEIAQACAQRTRPLLAPSASSIHTRWLPFRSAPDLSRKCQRPALAAATTAPSTELSTSIVEDGALRSPQQLHAYRACCLAAARQGISCARFGPSVAFLVPGHPTLLKIATVTPLGERAAAAHRGAAIVQTPIAHREPLHELATIDFVSSSRSDACPDRFQPFAPADLVALRIRTPGVRPLPCSR